MDVDVDVDVNAAGIKGGCVDGWGGCGAVQFFADSVALNSKQVGSEFLEK